VFEHPQSQAATVDGLTAFALRYIQTSVGALTSDGEAREFNHLKQNAFSLVGKVTAIIAKCDTAGAAVCEASIQDQFRVMTTADGTIITGYRLANTNPLDGPGAHLGVNVHLLRRIGRDVISIGPALLECSSNQTNPTPNYWQECNLKLDFGLQIDGPLYFYGLSLVAPFSLKKVNALQNPACSVFQDGYPAAIPTI
jgi:hypothetical protein